MHDINRLEQKDILELYNDAMKIDPDATKKISSNDKKRIIRILEIYHSTGKTKTELEINSRKELKYDYRIFILNMDRNILYDRINQRVDLMIENGLINEVENIVKKYKKFPTAMQGLGYKEVVSFLEGKITKDDMIEKIKQESRRYAKRQLTWFRTYKNAIWLDAIKQTKEENAKIILEEISERK